jgi:acyl-CoA thioesterase YciA
MPADANPNGDIFGGWVLSQMDIAGGLAAAHRAGGRVTTAAVEGMSFHLPVYVGDEVSCYAEVVRVGRSSLTVAVETWARRRATGKTDGETVRVTEGVFIYVALDDSGRPRPVPDRDGDG